jgi:hypothetical protein
MLILVGHATTPDKIKITQDAAGTLDIHASYADLDSTAAPPVVQDVGKANIAMTTATTTDLVAAPTTATRRRNVKTMHIRNKHASLTTNVTVVFDAIDGSDYELFKTPLKAGETLEYVEGVGFFVTTAAVPNLLSGNANLADQSANAANTYLAGSGYTCPGRIRSGTSFRWYISATKTAAGVATPIWTVVYGTAGTTADTARLTFTGLAQTGVADTGLFIICVNVRTYSSSGIISGTYGVAGHRLAATGFVNQAIDAAQATSATFDMTVANSIIGICVNPGSAGNWTIKEVSLDAVNLINEV